MGEPPLPNPLPLKGTREIRFAGYAAVFDWPDRGGDVIRAGAFKRALERAGDVPLLWQHKGAAIGRIEHLSEDRRGLRVIGRVADARIGALVQRGLRGLSFGYRVRAARNGAMRELVDLDLIEVSLVARPMQPRARVHAVE
ncbi:MAG TPA: HK97 family phage prohead protease [Sphingomicrobium sp.]